MKPVAANCSRRNGADERRNLLLLSLKLLCYCFQPASQAARKKPTRSRMKDGSSFRKMFVSSPIRDRISMGSRMRSMKI